MKKLLVAVAALLTCVGMNAQFWAGGSIGFNMTSYDYDGAKSQMNVKFAPTVGFGLNDNLEVGLSLGYGMVSNDGGGDNSKTSISITPFARYTFMQEGKVGLFFDAQIGYESYSEEYRTRPDYNTSYYSGPIPYTRTISDGSQIKVGVAPGIKIAIADELTLASTLGFFGFSHHTGADGGSVDNNKFGVDINTTVSFGLYYTF